MILPSLLILTHLLGLALATGAATVKLVLLTKSYFNKGFVQIFIKVSRPITGIIILGMILLTLSGIGWLLTGFPFTPLLIMKIVLFVAVWVLGPIIDNVVEPKFISLIPQPGEVPSATFIRAHKHYMAFEIIATLLFYVIIFIWVKV